MHDGTQHGYNWLQMKMMATTCVFAGHVVILTLIIGVSV